MTWCLEVGYGCFVVGYLLLEVYDWFWEVADVFLLRAILNTSFLIYITFKRVTIIEGYSFCK